MRPTGAWPAVASEGKAEGMRLLRRGAEADIYLTGLDGEPVVVKRRRVKGYRHREIDASIRSHRTAHEAHLMHEAKAAGVPTPFLYFVDLEACEIVMEYLEGERVREALEGWSADRRRKVCEQIGGLVGRLHGRGIVHGDLTTSNLILRGGKLFLIDFGLAFHSTAVEDRGMDLFLLLRALESSHFRVAAEALRSLARGYRQALGRRHAREVLRKVEEIKRRGRYIHERGL